MPPTSTPTAAATATPRRRHRRSESPCGFCPQLRAAHRVVPAGQSQTSKQLPQPLPQKLAANNNCCGSSTRSSRSSTRMKQQHDPVLVVRSSPSGHQISNSIGNEKPTPLFDDETLSTGTPSSSVTRLNMWLTRNILAADEAAAAPPVYRSNVDESPESESVSEKMLKKSNNGRGSDVALEAAARTSSWGTSKTTSCTHSSTLEEAQAIDRLPLSPCRVVYRGAADVSVTGQKNGNAATSRVPATDDQSRAKSLSRTRTRTRTTSSTTSAQLHRKRQSLNYLKGPTKTIAPSSRSCRLLEHEKAVEQLQKTQAEEQAWRQQVLAEKKKQSHRGELCELVKSFAKDFARGVGRRLCSCSP